MKKNKILQIIKYILFIIFLLSLIKLIPSTIKVGIIGQIFLTISIIYIISEAFIFLIKDKKSENNILQNIMKIILYIYVALLAYRYITFIENPVYQISNIYFKINYIITSIGMIGIIFNSITILNER